MTFKRREKNTLGVKWTDSETQMLTDLIKNDQIVYNELTEMFPERSLPAIRNKIRKLRISDDLFGASYRNSKLDYTIEIASSLKPTSVFEAYAGTGFQTVGWSRYATNVYCSERLKRKLVTFQENLEDFGFEKLASKNWKWNLFAKKEARVWYSNVDALEAATWLSVNVQSVDVIDLDTCGSSLPTLPIFLSLLKPKYLVITHGEFHSLRFKREDVLRRLLPHHDITKPILPITNNELAIELDKAVKLYALRAHNETTSSFWLDLIDETWLGSEGKGMLRRVYKVSRPTSTADCLNFFSK